MSQVIEEPIEILGDAPGLIQHLPDEAELQLNQVSGVQVNSPSACDCSPSLQEGCTPGDLGCVSSISPDRKVSSQDKFLV